MITPANTLDWTLFFFVFVDALDRIDLRRELAREVLRDIERPFERVLERVE